MGRTSHQILDALGIDFVAVSVSMSPVKSSHDPISGGIPVRGKFRNTTLRYDLSPVFRPIQKGELVESASTCGRK